MTQIASSGRYCVAPDRASHFSLSHLYWDPYATDESSITKLLMDGLTTKPASELVPLAKSWLSAPSAEVVGEAFRSEGYDPAQRAFVVARMGAAKPATLTLTLGASESSPAVNPAIVVKDWGIEKAQLKINGKPVAWGKDFPRGFSRGSTARTWWSGFGRLRQVQWRFH